MPWTRLSHENRARSVSPWVSIALALGLCACERNADSVVSAAAVVPPPLPEATVSDAQAVTAQQSPSLDAQFERFAGSAFEVAEIAAALGRSPLSELRPVGTTSVVFRADLDAPFRAAVKLSTYDRPLGPAAEAAAYRLARCLGLTTVPPVVLRRVAEQDLERALDQRFAERWQQLSPHILFDPQRTAEAAVTFWIEGMRELPVATRQGREPVLQALVQGAAPEPQLQLMAAQLSDLIVFDVVIGNGDRWSGGNVQGDATGQWLYIRDHDLAFASRLRPEVETRLLKQLYRVERFSRGLIGRLRTLSAERFEQEWQRDPQLGRRAQWLRERVAPGVLERRTAVLRHVQDLVGRHGEQAVLAFP